MNISILGCGWLGLPLAKNLIELDHKVNGSTTNRDKMRTLSSEGIVPYKIQLFEEAIQGDISSFLGNSEVLIIDIPPGLRKDPEINFVAKIGRLKSYVEKSGIKKLLFVSATSVYEDGENFPVYSENDSPNGNAENSIQLRGAESLLKDSEKYETSIVRFGGLIGPGRHPVNYLSGKSNLKDPEGPVNLIHLEDCIGIITAILKKEAWGETFHGVYPDHPTRKNYYSRTAKEKELASISFDDDSVSKGKIIKSVKIDKVLGYHFKGTI